jgi:hypothetical protein
MSAAHCGIRGGNVVGDLQTSLHQVGERGAAAIATPSPIVPVAAAEKPYCRCVVGRMGQWASADAAAD